MTHKEPHDIDKLYHARRKNCGRKPKLKQQALRNYVPAKLILKWTPEQISGRTTLTKSEARFLIQYLSGYFHLPILPMRCLPRLLTLLTIDLESVWVISPAEVSDNFFADFVALSLTVYPLLL